MVDHATAIDELRAALGDKVSVNASIREHHSKDESFHAPVVDRKSTRLNSSHRT